MSRHRSVSGAWYWLRGRGESPDRQLSWRHKQLRIDPGLRGSLSLFITVCLQNPVYLCLSFGIVYKRRNTRSCGHGGEGWGVLKTRWDWKLANYAVWWLGLSQIISFQKLQLVSFFRSLSTFSLLLQKWSWYNLEYLHIFVF